MSFAFLPEEFRVTDVVAMDKQPEATATEASDSLARTMDGLKTLPLFAAQSVVDIASMSAAIDDLKGQIGQTIMKLERVNKCNEIKAGHSQTMIEITERLNASRLRIVELRREIDQEVSDLTVTGHDHSDIALVTVREDFAERLNDSSYALSMKMMEFSRKRSEMKTTVWPKCVVM